MRTIEGHHDFAVLEHRLASLIREVAEADRDRPFTPVAIIAPTRRQLAHLQTILAGAFPALLEAHFYHHAAFAREALHAAGMENAQILPDRVREALVGQIIGDAGGALADYARARPGAVSALLGVFEDLREAGVASAGADRLPGLSPTARQVLALYAAYEARLEAAGKAGPCDLAGLLRRAREAVPGFARRFRLVIHYGAYDLIGANLDLLRSIERSAGRLAVIAPHHPTAPAFAFARDFWSEWLGEPPARLACNDPEPRLLAARLPLLHDETTPGAPLERPVPLQAFHAQGPAAELTEVALRILALRRESGMRLDRIGVVARSLDPYAALLAPVFDRHGLPFVTTATAAATREPVVRATLDLVRCVTGDFERQPLFDLCRGGLLRVDGIDPFGSAHDWDRLARQWRVGRGHDLWARQLPGWIEEWAANDPADSDPAVAGRIGAYRRSCVARARDLATVVRVLGRSARPLREASSWSAWADALDGLARRHIAVPDDERSRAAGAVVLDRLRELCLFGEAGVPFSAAAAQKAFESGLAAAVLPVSSESPSGVADSSDNGGVRILDAMQARGLSFDALFLIGMNADLFPRRPREDPFLPDADRAILRRARAAPLPIKGGARDEEHLLLAILLGAARRHLCVSWQRADEDGKARVPSLALREIARLTTGVPDAGRLVRGAQRVAADPAAACAGAIARFRLLPPAEARQGLALALRSPARLLASLESLPEPEGEPGAAVLGAGLAQMAAIDRRDSADHRFDADIGDAAGAPAGWSPSRLESLGRCPQHYFFRHVLRVDEMLDLLEDYDVEAREIGALVHDVLRDVYAGLRDEERLAPAPSDPQAAVSAARRRAAGAWEGRCAALRRRMQASHPLLWETTSTLWLAALDRFLAADVGALAERGTPVLRLEEPVEAGIDLGDAGAPLPIHGRLDRITARPGECLVVSDYKTSGALDRHVSAKDALKGIALQMPLYLLMAEARRDAWGAPGLPVLAEVLGVGPEFEAGEDREDLPPDLIGRHRAGLLETIATLSRLAASGHYPLNEASPLCRFCPYTRACRKDHPPTLERLAGASAGQEYALLRRKSTRAATLNEVRARIAAADEEDES